MLITDQETLRRFGTDFRIWQGIPAIERTKKGRLFCTFYSGKTTETLGNFCPLIYSDDDGKTWTEPIATAYDGEMSRCFDPVLWIDPLGRLWFIWDRAPKLGVYASICEDPDAEILRWSEEFYIGKYNMICKPTVLSSGEWLFPIAVWDIGAVCIWFNGTVGYTTDHYEDNYEEFLRYNRQYSGANVYVTSDNGKSFRFLGGCSCLNARIFEEHMVYEQKDGVLVMLMRTLYGIARSYSYDRGSNWTPAENSGIPGPCSRFHVRRLRSGRLLLVNHHEFSGRNNLTAFLSEDDGKTWPYRLLLDERNEVSYPDMAESEDGYLYIIYDRDRGALRRSLAEAESAAREILLAKITEEDIMAGEIVSSKSFLKQIVNKLGKYGGQDDPYRRISSLRAEDIVRSFAVNADVDETLAMIFDYYPYNCENLHAMDRKAMDRVISKIRGGEGDIENHLNGLTEILNRATEEAKRTQEVPLVTSVIDYLRENVRDTFDLAELAERLNVSVYYMCHAFKKKLGVGILEYRNACRITLAKRYLITTGDTMTEIAYACGFGDASYFAARFREAEGMSPKQYRELHRTAEETK